MEMVGVDLGKRKSDVCVMGKVNSVTQRFGMATTRESFQRHFGNRARARIAVEACRDSGWVCDELTALGHEVELVDTTRARAIGIGQGRRKTDRRDAEALARMLWAGVVPRAHRLSDKARALRNVLHARAQFVAQRAQTVTMLRGQWQAKGEVLPGCAAENFAKTLRAKGDEWVLQPHVQALLKVLDAIDEALGEVEAQLRGLAEQHEALQRLVSVPGVGRVTGLTFIGALDDCTRFRRAHQVEAYLGLVPSESTTGGRRRLGGVTKAGNPDARRLLVQAAHSLMRYRKHAGDPIVVWARNLVGRRGKKVAAVALARKLAGMLFAIRRDGTVYDAAFVGRRSADGLDRAARRTRRTAAEVRRAAGPAAA